MGKYRKLTHVYYKFEYHIVFAPKYQFQILEGMVKSLLEHDLQVISAWKDVKVLELKVQKDHVIWYVQYHPSFLYRSQYQERQNK